MLNLIIVLTDDVHPSLLSFNIHGEHSAIIYVYIKNDLIGQKLLDFFVNEVQ